MTASARMPTLPLSLAAEPIPERDLIYHRQRLRNRVFDCVLVALADRVRLHQLSRTAIAKRMGKDPGQVSRLLSYPSNLTIDTLSDLLLAIGADLTLGHHLAENPPRTNYEHPWSKRHPRADEVLDLAAINRGRSATSSSSGAVDVRLNLVEST
jgi:hypothetical protein